MKNKITSTIITLILLTPLLLAQTTQTNLDNLNNISSENIQTYIDLNNEDRNTALENTEDPLKRHNANSQLTKELIREKFEASLASGAIRLIGKKFGINKEELLETNPNDLVIQGFENLKFAEKGNIIGDGNTYLDLDNLPRGLNKIEYKQGEFHLTFRNEGKLTIKDGGINKNGEINALEDSGNKINFKDLIFRTNEDGDELGKITLSKNGFLLQGDAEIIFNEINFKKHPDFKSFDTSEPNLKILSDKDFIVRGVDVEVPGVVKVNAFFEDDKSQPGFYPKTHITLGDTEPILDSRTNLVQINGNNIKAKGFGNIEVKGLLGKLEVDGDFFIKNGNLKIRIKDDKIIATPYGHFINKDNSLTKFNLNQWTINVDDPILDDEAGYTPILIEKYNVLLEDGKIVGIKTPKENEYVRLDENLDQQSIDNFLKAHKQDQKEINNLIKSIQDSNGDLDSFKNTQKTNKLIISKREYDPSFDFVGENTYTIDNIISSKSRSGENIFTVNKAEGGERYVFRGGQRIQNTFTAGLQSDFSKTTELIIIENKYARLLQGVKTTDKFREILPQTEFKLTITIDSIFAKKLNVLDGLFEKLDEIKDPDISIQQKDNFKQFIIKSTDYLKGNPSFNKAELTNYWYPQTEEEKRKPAFGLKLLNQPEKLFEISSEDLPVFKHLVTPPSEFLNAGNRFNQITSPWCQKIGKKIDRICGPE